MVLILYVFTTFSIITLPARYAIFEHQRPKSLYMAWVLFISNITSLSTLYVGYTLGIEILQLLAFATVYVIDVGTYIYGQKLHHFKPTIATFILAPFMWFLNTPVTVLLSFWLGFLAFAITIIIHYDRMVSPRDRIQTTPLGKFEYAAKNAV